MPRDGGYNVPSFAHRPRHSHDDRRLFDACLHLDKELESVAATRFIIDAVRSEDLRDERRTALLNGLPGGPFGDVLGLAPLGPRLLGNNWRGPEGRVRVPTGSRAPTVRASLFPLRLHARPVRARANQPIARAHYSASADDMVMMLGVP